MTEDSDDEKLVIPCENQCHVCKQKLESHDDFWDHVQRQHEEYYNGVLEAAANLYNCHSPTQPQLELVLDLIMGRNPPTHHQELLRHFQAT